MCNKAQLGYATTRELLAELSARFEVHTEGGLNYRTVDPARDGDKAVHAKHCGYPIYGCVCRAHERSPLG